MTMEDARQAHLLDTLGPIAAAEWYEYAATRYALGADRATWPIENLGKLQVARGKEWARMYRVATLDCYRRARRLRRIVSARQ